MPATEPPSPFHAGALRCPFCRDEVALDDEPWLACATCLARHHRSCWREVHGCSACGQGRHLLPPRALIPRQRRAPWRGMLAGASIALFGMTTAWMLAGPSAQAKPSVPPPQAAAPEATCVHSVDVETSGEEVARLHKVTAALEADLARLRQKKDASRRASWLKEVNRSLEEELAELRDWYARAQPLLDQLASPQVVLAINGRIAAVKTNLEPALVLLNVGRENGVQAGLQFTIYRKDQFVAKVQVERVLKDAAGCRVLFTAEGQQVRVGDQAATRLQ